MITVTGKQVREIEYLIDQSIQGHHVLFDAGTIRKVLQWQTGLNAVTRSENPSPEAAEQFRHSEQMLEHMLALPTLAQKRAFLENLDHEDFEGVVRLWFNVVENSLFRSTGERH